MIALIGDEHVDPLQPYPALPNIIYLSLFNSSITDQGCIELSKSRLLDQLEYLEMLSWNEPGPKGDKALLTAPLYSNMKRFRSPNDTDYNISPETTHQHLSNAINQLDDYDDVDSTQIDQFWDQ